MRWTDEALDRWREVGDPLADAVAQEVDDDRQWASVNRALASFERNDDAPPSPLPETLRAYLDATTRVPSWADASRLRCSAELFTRNGPWIMLALHCASLPYSYAAANGVKALHFTSSLNRHTWRRLLNTAQFVVDVMAPGAFEPHGHALRSIQKVRLMHAAVRLRLTRHEQWDMAWGLPLNQEDQAGTLLTFSCLVLDALTKMGASFSEREAQSFLHAWRVVGSLLGVDETLSTEDRLEGERLGRAIERRQVRPSTEGRILTRSLLEYLEQRFAVMGTTGLPQVLIRRFLGDHIGDVLGISPSKGNGIATSSLEVGVKLMSRASGRSSLVARAPEVLGRRLLERLCRAEHGQARASFRVPQTLLRRWAVVVK